MVGWLVVALGIGFECLYREVPNEISLLVAVHLGQLGNVQVEGHVQGLVPDVRDVLLTQIV